MSLKGSSYISHTIRFNNIQKKKKNNECGKIYQSQIRDQTCDLKDSKLFILHTAKPHVHWFVHLQANGHRSVDRGSRESIKEKRYDRRRCMYLNKDTHKEGACVSKAYHLLVCFS